jgi:hypothetical protein
LIFVSSSLVYSHKPNRNLREFILTSLVLVSTQINVSGIGISPVIEHED